MKQILKYYYNIEIDDFEMENNVCFFNLNKSNFYLVPFTRDENNLIDIIEVSKEMIHRKIDCHNIILNRFNKALTQFNNINYILLNVGKNFDDDINIFDMHFINQKLRVNNDLQKKYKNNWQNNWSHNIDYFEMQIRNYGKLKTGILNTFSYYTGMAEIAIEYAGFANTNFIIDEGDYISLSHRRIFYPNYKLNYLNPISFIFDLEIRDYAEYFKTRFFYEENVYQELTSFFKTVKFGAYSYNMFYARLLYPSYYFDLYEKVLIEGKSEESLINIVSKQKEYERFLHFAYNEISKYAPIKKISWLTL